MEKECINCQITAFSNLLEKHKIQKNEAEKSFQEFTNFLSSINLEEKIAPEISQISQNKIKKLLNINDLYVDEKLKINLELLDQYDFYKNLIEKSKNKFITALKIAIAGNIIDIVSNPNYNIHKTIGDVLFSNFAIDNSELLFEEIKKAKTILYLGDNAGEIVLDKLFIEQINHKNIIYAVRGSAVLNDATIDDANLVKMQNVAKVISNGDNAPSTILKNCSTEFLEIYENADLIISKGMGNLEGLLHNGNSKIFFLSMIKCDVIAKLVNAKKGDFIVLKNLGKVKS